MVKFRKQVSYWFNSFTFLDTEKVMSKLETGGPAFPSASHYTTVVSGMTLLDHFAGQALKGELASQSQGTGEYYRHTEPNQLANLARRCYVFAQAMLVERNRLEQEAQKLQE